LHFQSAHLENFFDFSVLIMKTHPKLMMYEVFSQSFFNDGFRKTGAFNLA
jgi:hypothetical protein